MFEERPRKRTKFPVRTLILMVIALIAFLRMWWVMVERPAREVARGVQGDTLVIDGVLPQAQHDGGTP